MFIKTLILTAALYISPAKSQTVVKCPNFSESQTQVIKKSHKYGKEHMGGDWGLVMAAIAYQESSAGNLVTNKKGSYGVFQNKLSTVVSRTGEKPHTVKAKLIKDFHYSAEQSKKELDYWNGRYYSKTHQDNNLMNVLASYNAGYHVSAGRRYAREVRSKMRVIDICVINPTNK